ncbi:hypothetical protein BgiBS90_014567 [Biomphalaria glabrata]|nr:hypothetical protein BgiBS90_014567 [Biomphalaria glabrata]
MEFPAISSFHKSTSIDKSPLPVMNMSLFGTNRLTKGLSYNSAPAPVFMEHTSALFKTGHGLIVQRVSSPAVR